MIGRPVGTVIELSDHRLDDSTADSHESEENNARGEHI